MRDRSDEKERLWKEVLGRKRAYESDGAADAELTDGEKRSEVPGTNSILKSADRAMDELNRILLKQKKDLEEMSAAVNADKGSDIREETLLDVDQLQKDIESDYGVTAKAEVKEDFDSAAVFAEIQETMNASVLGQKDAVKALCTAFRRPFVMGYEEDQARNVILVAGPHGSGKHASLSEMTRLLYQKQIFVSKDVITIDMSRYTSGAQEQIFLQDLYEALNAEGSVVCFENFETSFPAFLRMVDSLVINGNVVLNKRYVLSKGVLVENQTGLVKDAVDSLSANGKYLVFITSGKTSKVQDAFGADFMYHVLDTVNFVALDEETVCALISSQTDALIQKCAEKLRVSVTADEALRSWVHTHFDKTRGADSITAIFYDFYVSISQAVLDQGLGSNESLSLTVRNDVPVALVAESEVRLSREKNSSEEIEAINQELDEIVGLDMVKDYIRSLQSHIAIQQKRKEQGMKTASVSKHMIFTGNPGTGKTTIARLISRYMKAIGALSEGQLVEVTRADLVAQYVGQTAPLTMSVIKSAIGGVLFIDEAYSLYRGKDDSFGLEAIDTLVKAMEDNRDNLIVILAGYKKEMAGFLESNSGLKSRFPNLINFPDYTGDELTKIAIIQAKFKGYVVEDAAVAPLTEYFNKVQSINAAEAGNGRLSRNVVEEAVLRQSERLVKDPEADMSVLIKDDFNYEVKVKPAEKKEDASLEDLMKMVNQANS